MQLPNVLVNYRYILLGIFVFIVLFLIGYYTYKWYSPNKQFSNISNKANGSSTPIDIYILTASWCPFCRNVLPKWQSFCDKTNNTFVNGSLITCHTIDCTNNDDPEVVKYLNKFNVKGFPSVKMIKDGEIINFDSKINENTLTQFVQKMSV